MPNNPPPAHVSARTAANIAALLRYLRTRHALYLDRYAATHDRADLDLAQVYSDTAVLVESLFPLVNGTETT